MEYKKHALPLLRKHAVRCFVYFQVSLCLASISLASTPRLNLITPRGVQRGHEHVLRFTGNRLLEAQEVFLYDDGIEILEVKSVDAKNVDVKILVTDDCRLGEHIAQIRTNTRYF